MKYREMEWTDEYIKKFWDYESNFKENYFTYQVGSRVVEYLQSYLKGRKNILDFGCGAGYLINHLLEIGLEVYGLDFSDASIEKVNEKYKENPSFKGAFMMERFIADKGKYDSIIATEVIEHLDDDKLNSTMEFIKESLADDGIAIFTTPNDEDLSKSMIYCPEADCIFHRWQHVRSWTEESLYSYMAQYFGHIEILTTSFGSSISSRQKIKNHIKIFLGIYREEKHNNLMAIVKK